MARTTQDFIAQLNNVNKNILVLGDYSSSADKILVRCLIDEYEWSPIAKHLLSGHGCPKCAGVLKKTHEQFIKELNNINPNIKVLSKYINAKTKISVQCTIDDHTWFSEPTSLLKGHGCAKCSKVLRKSSQDFVDQLYKINPLIEVLSTYVNTKHKIKVRCKVDEFVWDVTPNSLLSGTGCHRCAGTMRKTHQEFLNGLYKASKNIEILGRYVNNTSRIRVRCKIDSYEWEAYPANITKGTGCPKCAGILKKTSEEFIKELNKSNPNITVLEEYKTAKNSLLFKCKLDGHIWRTTPHAILCGTGCPKCAKYGYDSSKLAYFYLYKFDHYIGFGITNYPETRYKQHNKTFSSNGIEAKLILEFNGKGLEVRELEAYLKKTLPVVDSGIIGFKTECILYKDIDLLYNLLNSNPLDISLTLTKMENHANP